MTRLPRNKAREAYEKGSTIKVLPCNVALDNPWIKPFEINKERYEKEGYSFDDAINLYKFYNCNYELGYYASYFI